MAGENFNQSGDLRAIRESIATLAAGAPASAGATEAKQDTIIGHVDGVETALIAANASLDAIEAVPAPMTSTNFLDNMRSPTGTHSSVASGTASVTILASNVARKGARIRNSDANALHLDLSGGTATVDRAQVTLLQNESYAVDAGYTGAITGIWAADGSGVASVVEFA